MKDLGKRKCGLRRGLRQDLAESSVVVPVGCGTWHPSKTCCRNLKKNRAEGRIARQNAIRPTPGLQEDARRPLSRG